MTKTDIEWLEYANQFHYGNHPEINTAVKHAIEALERTRWIPVSERLPEVVNSKVAVVWQDGDVTLCHTRDVAEFIRVTQSSKEDYITHWMPLPEAPKEVE